MIHARFSLLRYAPFESSPLPVAATLTGTVKIVMADGTDIPVAAGAFYATRETVVQLNLNPQPLGTTVFSLKLDAVGDSVHDCKLHTYKDGTPLAGPDLTFTLPLPHPIIIKCETIHPGFTLTLVQKEGINKYVLVTQGPYPVIKIPTGDIHVWKDLPGTSNIALPTSSPGLLVYTELALKVILSLPSTGIKQIVLSVAGSTGGDGGCKFKNKDDNAFSFAHVVLEFLDKEDIRTGIVVKCYEAPLAAKIVITALQMGTLTGNNYTTFVSSPISMATTHTGTITVRANPATGGLQDTWTEPGFPKQTWMTIRVILDPAPSSDTRADIDLSFVNNSVASCTYVLFLLHLTTCP
jgi:hypothetical protein